MRFSHVCDSCGRSIRLDFDESESTPSFCPFCGEDLADVGEFNEDDIDVKLSDWDNDGVDNF